MEIKYSSARKQASDIVAGDLVYIFGKTYVVSLALGTSDRRVEIVMWERDDEYASLKLTIPEYDMVDILKPNSYILEIVDDLATYFKGDVVKVVGKNLVIDLKNLEGLDLKKVTLHGRYTPQI